METLGAKQRRFSLLVAQWIVAVNKMGYAVTFGEAYRSDEQAEINAMGATGRADLVRLLMPHWPELARRIANNVGSGIRNSLHESRLAVDVNLFYGGTWISDGASPHWERAGKLWESMGGTWGGRFRDANHLSLEHEGRR
ncbi:MAG: M15 family metallopeptidase [Gammaproteobacteria bacterium]|nr:M15 family metallopeptidase [Gammaproteobacteria bacterium]